MIVERNGTSDGTKNWQRKPKFPGENLLLSLAEI
jgi:hypothetical protein